MKQAHTKAAVQPDAARPALDELHGLQPVRVLSERETTFVAGGKIKDHVENPGQTPLALPVVYNA